MLLLLRFWNTDCGLSLEQGLSFWLRSCLVGMRLSLNPTLFASAILGKETSSYSLRSISAFLTFFALLGRVRVFMNLPWSGLNKYCFSFIWSNFCSLNISDFWFVDSGLFSLPKELNYPDFDCLSREFFFFRSDFNWRCLLESLLGFSLFNSLFYDCRIYIFGWEASIVAKFCLWDTPYLNIYFIRAISNLN